MFLEQCATKIIQKKYLKNNIESRYTTIILLGFLFHAADTFVTALNYTLPMSTKFFKGISVILLLKALKR